LKAGKLEGGEAWRLGSSEARRLRNVKKLFSFSAS
jgi:hypothetical protein